MVANFCGAQSTASVNELHIAPRTILRDLLQQLETISATMTAKGDRKKSKGFERLADNLRKQYFHEAVTKDTRSWEDEKMPQFFHFEIVSRLMKEIVIDRAIAKVDCTLEEIDLAYQEFIREIQIENQEDLATWCDRHYFSNSKELKTSVARPLKIEKFKQETWEKALNSYFVESKAKRDRVSFSLLCHLDRDVTRELYFRICEGEQTFGELAQQYSFGAEAQTNGLVGPTLLSELNPIVAKILISSYNGQLRFPVAIDDYYAIIRLERFIPAKLDNTMRRQLLDELFDRWLSEQIEPLTSSLSLE
jgi:hypothetical protein